MSATPPVSACRTRLLVSVRDVPEAEAARRGGADLIDIKNPDAGPLGMADSTIIDAILDNLGDAAPITAALGELSEHARPPETSPRLRHVKLGLAHAPADWRKGLDEHFRFHNRHGVGDRFIGVAYADHMRSGAPSVAEVLEWAVSRRAGGVLIDTAVKDGRSLKYWCDMPTVRRWIETAHRHRMFVALAGSLDPETILRLLPLGPDIIAVRGAACENNDRTARISARKVNQIKDSVTPPGECAASAGTLSR